MHFIYVCIRSCVKQCKGNHTECIEHHDHFVFYVIFTADRRYLRYFSFNVRVYICTNCDIRDGGEEHQSPVYWIFSPRSSCPYCERKITDEGDKAQERGGEGRERQRE